MLVGGVTVLDKYQVVLSNTIVLLEVEICILNLDVDRIGISHNNIWRVDVEGI